MLSHLHFFTHFHTHSLREISISIPIPNKISARKYFVYKTIISLMSQSSIINIILDNVEKNDKALNTIMNTQNVNIL